MKKSCKGKQVAVEIKILNLRIFLIYEEHGSRGLNLWSMWRHKNATITGMCVCVCLGAWGGAGNILGVKVFPSLKNNLFNSS